MNGSQIARTVLGAIASVGLVAACGGGASPREPNAPDPSLESGPPRGSADGSNSKGPAKADIAKGTKALEGGDLEGAKAAFAEARKKDPNDPEAAYYAGLVADKSGDRAGAEKGYRDALALKGDLEAAAENLAAILIESGRSKEALPILDRAIAAHKDNPQLAQNHAIALAETGDVAGARKAFDDAARLAPKDALVLVTYGQWLGKWKDAAGAKEKLTAAARLAGDDVGVLASVGFELKNVGAFDECIGVLGKAIDKKDVAELRTYRALCKMGNKDKEGARADLALATQKEPNYAPAHFYLGGRLAEGGKLKEAESEYAAYLKLAPTGPLAAQAKERQAILQKKAGGKK